jgi:hypothetical protein
MDKPLTLEQCVDSLYNWAFSDSRVELDRKVLEDQLRTDFEIAGRFMSEKECEEFICGDDEGEVPEDLIELFPQTHEFIASYWE